MQGEADPLPLEVALVWAMFIADAVAILITYSRLPVHELYHVSGSGLRGGSSRVLVDSNFPLALAAIANLLILVDRLRRLRLVAVLGIVLCLPVFWPGVVRQSNLDARPVNAIAGVGVLLALALSLLTGFRGWSRNVRGDGYRDVVGTLAVLVALPWIFAELGFFLDRVPLLGRVFETGVYRMRGAEVAVHHGHHHGLDGLLLLLTAILLSRVVPGMRTRGLRLLLAVYLSLMAAYGIGNMANDFWTEQIWKRGWTNWQFPSLLQPAFSLGWGLLLLGAALILAMSVESSHTRRGRLAGRRR
ncbi:MAG: hypothetical protein ACTHKS_09855 [Gaiellaceae bacterium]